MGPPKVPEFHFPRTVVENELRLIEVLFGRLGAFAVEFGYILALLGAGLPSGRFASLQLVGDPFKREGGCAVLRPDDVAVKVVAVMVGVKNVLHWFGGETFGIG